jgi:hypothetical protein
MTAFNTSADRAISDRSTKWNFSMKRNSAHTYFLISGLICLFAGCASEPGDKPAPTTVAAATNCVITEPKIGSNMNHRECTAAAASKPATDGAHSDN